ncbi:MAG: SGNH/GDSL hydrolase family protein [Isosphaeraceae bacterium]
MAGGRHGEPGLLSRTTGAVGRAIGLRPRAPRQENFAFVQRAIRRERAFKRAIVVATCLVVAMILRVLPWGRYLATAIESTTIGVAHRTLGMTQSRAEKNREWERFRRIGIETTRPRVESFFAHSDLAVQRLMRHVGMDPEHGLLRWANYNWTFLLSSKVFEPDDRRSYRFRPNGRAVWLQHLAFIAGTPAFYLVPDDPGLADAMRGTAATIIESSRQMTNSWGLRGPEPDPDAPLRGIVLGDSFMQGMFVGDEDTPPECLRRYLEAECKTRASVLNTGIFGYSTEQYYYSMIEFIDRFRPQFVVVSVFANDGGGEGEAVSRGVGDWYEVVYWLDEIVAACRRRHCVSLIVAAPMELCIVGERNSGNYPGQLVNTLTLPGEMFLDPMDDFLNAHLLLRKHACERGADPRTMSLFNDGLNDGHFSPAGSRVWAESVGRRLIRLMDQDRACGEPGKGNGRTAPPYRGEASAGG